MGGTNIKQMYWCREGQKNQKLFCQASCFPLPVFPFPSSPVMPQPLIAASYTKDVKVFFFGFVSRTLAEKISTVKGPDGVLDFC